MRIHKIHFGFAGSLKTYCGLSSGTRGGDIKQTTCLNCLKSIKALVDNLIRITPAQKKSEKQKPLWQLTKQ